MCAPWLRRAWIVSLPLILTACASTPDELSAAPERYGALDAWISGEIAEVTDGGGRLRLVPLGSSGLQPPRPGADGLLGGHPVSTWVELRYAKGWVYFDAVDGGDQAQVTLQEGRERFAIGQRIAIGRSTERQGGFDRRGVQAATPTAAGGGTELRFRGWIMVRVTETAVSRRPEG